MNPGMPVVCDRSDPQGHRYAILQLKELAVDQARYSNWLATVAHAALLRKRREEARRALDRVRQQP